MSRERMISPSLWTSWHFKGHPMGMKILFAALLHEADNHGRYQPEPERLCSLYFPHDSVSPEDIAKWLRILDESRDSTGVGPIRLYEVDGLQYLDIPKFHAPHHQALQYPSRPKYPMHPSGPYTEKARRWALEKGETLPAGLPEPKDAPRKHARAAAKRGLQGPEPKKKVASPKKANRAKKEFVDSVINNWNTFAEKHGYACVRMDTKSIREKIVGRFADAEWQGDYWPPMLARLETLSPHYRGENDHSWKINLPFLIRNDLQAQKLLNGEWSAAAKTRKGYTEDEAKAGMADLEKQGEEVF